MGSNRVGYNESAVEAEIRTVMHEIYHQRPDLRARRAGFEQYISDSIFC